MADERLRELERKARETGEADDLRRELKRVGKAFDDCDWCWGRGFRWISGTFLTLCEFCQKGESKKREGVHIADEKKRFSSGSHWRHDSQARVARVLAGLHENATEKEARAALSGAFPFGPRKYHPYRIWCDEVKKQLRARFGSDEPAPLLDSKPSSDVAS